MALEAILAAAQHVMNACSLSWATDLQSRDLKLTTSGNQLKFIWKL